MIAKTKLENPRPRYSYVEGLRALACLTVVFNHAVAEAFPVFYRVDIPPTLSFLRLWFAFGHHAVTAFIVISGFCLGLPLAVDDFSKPVRFAQFMTRRIARILPPYYAALGVSIVVCFTMFRHPVGIHFDFSSHPRPTDIVAHFLLVQNVFGTGHINYSLWSIATELHIYMLFPLLVVILRKANGWLYVALIAVVAYGLSFVTTNTRLDRAALHFNSAFICGMAVSWITQSKRPVPVRLRNFVGWSPVFLAGIACIVLWTNAVPLREYQFIQLPQDSIVMITVSALLLACANKSILRTVLEWSPFVWIGERSYSLYLLHVPIQAAMLKFAISNFDLTHTERLMFALTFGFGTLIGTTWIFHRFVELPSMELSRRIYKLSNGGAY